MTGAQSFAFTAGILAALNPCGLAMLPSHLAVFVAVEGTGDAQHDALSRLLRGLGVAAIVSLGVAVTFVSAGVLISSGFSLLGRVLPMVGVALGVLLLTLGMAMVAGLPVPGLHLATSARRKASVGGMVWFGVAYGLGSLSCSLPVFLIVVGTSATQRSGATGFVAFTAGMSAVIAVATVFAALFSHLLAVVQLTRRYVPMLSGLLLLAAGTYVIDRDLPLAVVAGGHQQPSTGSTMLATAAITTAIVVVSGAAILTRRRSEQARTRDIRYF
ncbi:MAG TPA: cytochrome c biogenesis protein CcdA [Gaiellales bacterium]|nr:cytochrome c biogenesis protein CcdA [Gaiellales bacterium]